MLVEVNSRWHLTDFAPLTLACIGYEALSETISAYVDPERFGSLPSEPRQLIRHGRVVHLVCSVEGTLVKVQHMDELQSMESFAGIDVYPGFSTPGGHVEPTIDIRSDAGWVRLVHESEEVVEKDYQRTVDLMPT
ncbi:unnamed protein product, partial [Choristocarpus tenellus]